MTIADILIIAGGLWALSIITRRGLSLERQAEAAYHRPDKKGGRHD